VKKKIKVGVIGAGIGRTHLNGYQALSHDVEIAALCDLNQARLNEVAEQYSIPLRFTNFNKMIASGQIEAVSVCLPNNLHAPASVAALEAGLHVLCEKPLAENAAAGQKVVEAAANAPGNFMVCFNRRYRPDVGWMKDIINAEKLGRIYQVKAGWVRETGIPGWTGWFVNKEVAGGGPLVDLGVHMLDMVMWLLDYPDPLTVSGNVQTNFGPYGLKTWRRPEQGGQHPFAVEDSATAYIRLADNVDFYLETSWASHTRPGRDDFFVTLMGTQGTVELYVANYATENTLTFYTEMNDTPVTVRPHVVSARSDHVYAVAEFIKSIQKKERPPATAEDGLTIMKIIDAIYQSAEIKREVGLA